MSQAPRLLRLLAHVAAPLRYATEVPLARRADKPELRAWDVIVSGHGERTGIELETRVTDVQGMSRRHSQKRADDPVDHFLLVIAATKHNRRVMREFSPLLGDLPQLRPSDVLSDLQHGRHPSTGWMFL